MNTNEQAAIHQAYINATIPVAIKHGESIFESAIELLQEGYLLVWHSDFVILSIYRCEPEDAAHEAIEHYHITMLLHNHKILQMTFRTPEEALRAFPFQIKLLRYCTEEGLDKWEEGLDKLIEEASPDVIAHAFEEALNRIFERIGDNVPYHPN